MAKNNFPGRKLDHELLPYRGQWVALLGGRVVAAGGTPRQVEEAYRKLSYSEVPRVMYVPRRFPPRFSAFFYHIQDLLGPDPRVYLVGGAVRDALLSRTTHDLDFVLPDHSMKTARQLADRLGGAFFPLDQERETARVIFTPPGEHRQVLDFAAFRGSTLEEDLQARDFTMNAMAVSLANPDQILDPLGGGADLMKGALRACSPRSFQDDPLRILRAVRLAAQFEFRVTPPTISHIKEAISQLPRVSPERIRDEVFRILEGERAAAALASLHSLGVFPVLPLEIPAFSPRVRRVLGYLEVLLGLLAEKHDPERAGDWMRGTSVLRLGRYRDHIRGHMERELVQDRSIRTLVNLVGLHMDAPQPCERLISSSEQLRLSNTEIQYQKLITEGLSILGNFFARDHLPDRREVYRYFQSAREGGVDAVFLLLADYLAERGEAPPRDGWLHRLNVSRILLESWWEFKQERVAPPPLLNGDQLMDELGLAPGPLVGEILSAVQEEQAVGELNSREDALEFARRFVN